ncbi:hypothetical protein ACWD5A_27645, partial [Streptomyces sp. NPDC002491]
MTTTLSGRPPSLSAPTGAAAPRRRRRPDLGLLITAVALLVVIGAAVPLVAVLATAFAPDALPRYTEFFTSWVDLVVLRNTLVLGTLVGVCGTALGFLFAFVQARLDVPGKKILHVVALLPIVSPPFAIATATVVLYGRRGVVSNGVFGLEYDIYGLDGLVFVLSLSLFPVAYLGLLGMLRGLDPGPGGAPGQLGHTRGGKAARCLRAGGA